MSDSGRAVGFRRMLRRARPLLFVLASSPFGLFGCSGDSRRAGVKPDGGDAGPRCPPSVNVDTDFLPCDVEAVLVAKCQRCHDTPEHLAPCLRRKSCVSGPFPLLTYADTQQGTGNGRIFELMGQAVSLGYMPFTEANVSPPVEPLTDAEKSTLLDWIAACAPGTSTACARDASPDAP